MKRKTRSVSSSGASAERKTKKTKTKSGEELQEASTTTKLDFSSPENLFASLIAPTSNKDFFENYWEKKPLVINREDSEFYGALFSKAFLEVLLKKKEINYVEDINVCRYIDGEKEFLNEDEGTKATASKIMKKVKDDNATIQFHQPQRFQDTLWQLNGNLERFFGCLVGANVYITPPNAQGLAPHHDDVEVFILQLEGEKNWKLYSPLVELALDYSADLEEDSIGKPTHEFTLKTGDLLYFPRGTIHQAETLKCGNHSTHITLSTYQQNAWGHFISTALTDAIEKAMESDVKFRRGLPINFVSQLGLGMDIQGDDEKAIASKKENESFKKQLKELLIALVDHVDANETSDKMASDFMASRLPPFETEKDEKAKSEKPTADSEVKFLYPEYVRVTSGEAAPSGPIIALADSNSEDSEEGEESDDEGSDDEDMEVSEGEKKSKKKSANAENGGDKASKAKKEKKGDDDKEAKSKKEKKTKNGGKVDGKKTKKGKKKEESEEEEEKSEEEKKSKKKTKTKKGKKEKQESESEEESDAEYELGTEDSSEDSGEESGPDSEDEESGKAWVLVHHSLNNDRSHHMMGMPEPSVLKLAVTYQDALLLLYFTSP
ncbi:ribosomal oxygenase 2 isoform X2 [Nematostella vectensis]|uniref:ribosomal oxygenase 2 isoform X2 n=1 Tax=Nematostella vectensis TaxID=45351 RepID=UPI00139044FD|nr:ribosomal oxygenase 2 isoform X2 [Nematostella vectensis]